MTDRATIFALSTAPGRSGLAVIRVSGARAGEALRALTGAALPSPRRATLRDFRDPESGARIDRGLALWFPGPASATGEDLAELHLHGGRAVIAAMLAALSRLPGLRPAEAGEFARRAFRAGKLDLTEIEGLADLIAAETEAQRRQALRQLDGELGRVYDTWRESLIRALALAETAIDFAEEDIPRTVFQEIAATIAATKAAIGAHLEDGRRGERLRAGLSLAILGPPNAGKSSLLNHLAKRDAAIVAPEAGTTRDVVEVALDIGGYPVLLADTAGLRTSDNAIEAEGVRRAERRAAAADLTILLLDATRPSEIPPSFAQLMRGASLLVANKIDLAKPPPEILGQAPLAISLVSGEGLELFHERLVATIAALLESQSPAPPMTRERHRLALEETREALTRAADQAGSGAEAGAELLAEDLRLAVRALGRITGRVDVEDLLDRIFAEFCIGK